MVGGCLNQATATVCPWMQVAAVGKPSGATTFDRAVRDWSGQGWILKQLAPCWFGGSTFLLYIIYINSQRTFTAHMGFSAFGNAGRCLFERLGLCWSHEPAEACSELQVCHTGGVRLHGYVDESNLAHSTFFQRLQTFEKSDFCQMCPSSDERDQHSKMRFSYWIFLIPFRSNFSKSLIGECGSRVTQRPSQLLVSISSFVAKRLVLHALFRGSAILLLPGPGVLICCNQFP